MSIPKFRAWHKELKFMAPVVSIERFDPLICWVAYGGHTLECSPTSADLMQWTGLRDKNGVDIYEGDILTLGGIDNFFVEKIKCVYFLSFKVMKVQQGWIQHRKLMGDFCEKEFEVVGNICQNQELLNANT